MALIVSFVKPNQRPCRLYINSRPTRNIKNITLRKAILHIAPQPRKDCSCSSVMIFLLLRLSPKQTPGPPVCPYETMRSTASIVIYLLSAPMIRLTYAANSFATAVTYILPTSVIRLANSIIRCYGRAHGQAHNQNQSQKNSVHGRISCSLI